MRNCSTPSVSCRRASRRASGTGAPGRESRCGESLRGGPGESPGVLIRSAGDQAAGPAWCGQRRGPTKEVATGRAGAASVTSLRVPACRRPPCRGEAGDALPLKAWPLLGFPKPNRRSRSARLPEPRGRLSGRSLGERPAARFFLPPNVGRWASVTRLAVNTNALRFEKVRLTPTPWPTRSSMPSPLPSPLARRSHVDACLRVRSQTPKSGNRTCSRSILPIVASYAACRNRPGSTWR